MSFITVQSQLSGDRKEHTKGILSFFYPEDLSRLSSMTDKLDLGNNKSSNIHFLDVLDNDHGVSQELLRLLKDIQTFEFLALKHKPCYGDRLVSELKFIGKVFERRGKGYDRIQEIRRLAERLKSNISVTIRVVFEHNGECIAGSIAINNINFDRDTRDLEIIASNVGIEHTNVQTGWREQVLSYSENRRKVLREMLPAATPREIEYHNLVIQHPNICSELDVELVITKETPIGEVVKVGKARVHGKYKSQYLKVFVQIRDEGDGFDAYDVICDEDGFEGIHARIRMGSLVIEKEIRELIVSYSDHEKEGVSIYNKE